MGRVCAPVELYVAHVPEEGTEGTPEITARPIQGNL
jgi:hypothetical protein